MRSLLILVLLFSSCNFKNSAEGTLRDFVKYRFSQGQTKEGLLEYLDGQMYAEYDSMTDEEAVKFSDMSGHKRKGFKINYKNCTEAECSITYTIKYEVKAGDEKTLAEVKRSARLKLNDDQDWKVVEVLSEGSKTHFEGVKEITPEDFKEQYNVDSDNIKLDSSGNPVYDESGKAQTK